MSVKDEPDAVLINGLVDAHCWRRALLEGQSLDAIARTSHRDKRHITRLLHLSYLAPDLKLVSILQGRQPPGTTLRSLTRAGRRQDVEYTVAVFPLVANPEISLSTLRGALLRPRYPLYAGRRREVAGFLWTDKSRC